jgi:hypothetical protein
VKSFRTPEQLVRIYSASEAGQDIHDIAAEEGLSYASTFSALNYLRKYLKGKTRTQRRHSQHYQEAARLIRQQERKQPSQGTTEPQRQPPTTPQSDNFTFLKTSFDKFQNAVATFIEVEVNSRYTKLRGENKALNEDNRALRKELADLHKEIERLEQQAEEPKTVNWVDSLKDRITKEET